MRTKVKNRFYDGAAWRRLRKAFIGAHPLCEMDCRAAGRLTAATEVDHITPIAEGGEPLDEANLQSACRPCHSRKTSRDSGWARSA